MTWGGGGDGLNQSEDDEPELEQPASAAPARWRT